MQDEEWGKPRNKVFLISTINEVSVKDLQCHYGPVENLINRWSKN